MLIGGLPQDGRDSPCRTRCWESGNRKIRMLIFSRNEKGRGKMGRRPSPKSLTMWQMEFSGLGWPTQPTLNPQEEPQQQEVESKA
jgi:hypothetical protein